MLSWPGSFRLVKIVSFRVTKTPCTAGRSLLVLDSEVTSNWFESSCPKTFLLPLVSMFFRETLHILFCEIRGSTFLLISSRSEIRPALATCRFIFGIFSHGPGFL